MGFWNFKHLLCYAGVVYGGNLDEVANIPRKVTWFEDWTETLTPAEEQRRTGFWNSKHLLCVREATVFLQVEQQVYVRKDFLLDG
jgi:hypothetical protein